MTMRFLPHTAGLGALLCLLGTAGGAQGQVTTGYCPDGAVWSQACATTWDTKTKAYFKNLLHHTEEANTSTDKCGLGTPPGPRQSPINLGAPAGSNPNPAIEFKYTPTLPTPDTFSRVLTNNGHSVELPLEAPARSIVFRDQTYDLKQMHFHYPSEHIWNGERFALELHLVHANQTGRAVVAILIRKGQENVALKALFDTMPTTKSSTTTITVAAAIGANLRGLLPPLTDRSYVTYGGSLTTPTGNPPNKGCEENVTWLVLTTPITATQDQINKFKDAISYDQAFQVNARPFFASTGRSVSGSSSTGISLEFNGRMDDGASYARASYAQVPETPGLSLSTTLTLEAMVYWNGISGYSGIISNPRRGYSGSGHSLSLWEGKPILGVITASGEHRAAGNAATPLPVNVWAAVSVTYDGKQTITYVNGEKVGSYEWETVAGIAPEATGVLIGRGFLSGFDDRAFGGRLADVRIWNQTLSGETIAAWQDKVSLDDHPNTNALMARWRLNEGQGSTVARDSSRPNDPNRHDATLQNGAVWRQSP